ncbi:uncharacterized protein (UPF0548 family) [Streptacidiphilus sp. MAP12-33]|uniref:DUF1990 family protein n=1 Tax=Streptacidiphilus sp. MAP12-33 TaxID=3156266 RepID=UPI00351941CA
MTREFTYPEVGATLDADPLPRGYWYLHHRSRVGQGEAAFRAAADALATFRMHRGIPVGIRTSAARAEPGVDVRVSLAGIHAPCRIVRVIDEPGRYAWAYGTLPGHPECGEEAFLLTRDDDGAVWLDVTAFSRPGIRMLRPLGALVPPMQRLYARRCAQVLRGIARTAQ